jgi:hypothetical protein
MCCFNNFFLDKNFDIQITEMYRSEELLNKLFYVVEYNRVNASARIKRSQ